MNLPSTITIDGPAASGKSTVGRALAKRLGYLFFDTGVMYRAATLEVLRRGIDPDDEIPVSAVAESIRIDVKSPDVSDGRLYTVLLNSEDVTWAIRAPEVDANVSQVSTYRGVREAMTAQQRRIAAQGRVVMVGRDIGTVVLPEAEVKLYLDATAEARARRRWLETRARDAPTADTLSYEEVLEAVRKRDLIDSTRVLAPLCPADDAVVVDTTEMDLPAVLETVYAHVVKAREGVGL